MTSGSSATGSSGSITIQSSDSVSRAVSGDLLFSTGLSTSGTSGAIHESTGNAHEGKSGDVHVQRSEGNLFDGGDLFLTGGEL